MFYSCILHITCTYGSYISSLTAIGDSTAQPIVDFSDDIDNIHLSDDGVVSDDNVPLISKHGQVIINDADPNPESEMEAGGSPYTHTTNNDKYDGLLIIDRSMSCKMLNICC